jgi:hypothetical protein
MMTCNYVFQRSCTDLGDNDLELTVVRGINYNLPAGRCNDCCNVYVRVGAVVVRVVIDF